ncbi:MAG: hypothetical protein AAB444_03650 [Patescibacteria group bacterium]
MKDDLMRLLEKEKNFHVRLLRYADMREVFTITEIRTDLSLIAEQITLLHRETENGNFFERVGNSSNGEDKYMLTLEGKSRLLEYDELVLARNSSREAKRYAIIAIIISVIALAASIGIGVIQLITTQNVKISNESIKTEVINLKDIE